MTVAFQAISAGPTPAVRTRQKQCVPLTAGRIVLSTEILFNRVLQRLRGAKLRRTRSRDMN